MSRKPAALVRPQINGTVHRQSYFIWCPSTTVVCGCGSKYICTLKKKVASFYFLFVITRETFFPSKAVQTRACIPWTLAFPLCTDEWMVSDCELSLKGWDVSSEWGIKDRSCLGPMYSLALFGFWSTIFAQRNCLAGFRLLCPCVSGCGRGNGEGVHEGS